MKSDEIVRVFAERLKQAGRRSMTRHAKTVLEVFVASSVPVAAKDVLYSVKRFDPLISKATVHNVLNELLHCGLATAIAPERHREPTRYVLATPTDALQPCTHPHWVCKDCGATRAGRPSPHETPDQP
jgi:Fe2+ or Zn2+ uptake regulation protein